jgi:hypothetical protein
MVDDSETGMSATRISENGFKSRERCVEEEECILFYRHFMQDICSGTIGANLLHSFELRTV